jgi:hypothetical protein
MSSLEFEDQNSSLSNRQFQYQNSIQSQSFLVKHHIVKSENSANKIMLVILVIILISTIISIWKIYKNNKPKEIRYNLSSDVIKRLPIEAQTKLME